NCNIGAELASEHKGRATSAVTLRNNFIYSNTEVGIVLGGYDSQRGRTERCSIINNSLYNNDTNHSGSGELLVQYDTRYNIIKNNIFYANAQKIFFSSWSAVMAGNQVDNNLFFVAGGAGSWQWKNISYDTFEAYKAGTGNDLHSLNQKNPLFVSASGFNLHLLSTSPAINRGANLSQAGTLDFDGQPRKQGTFIDLGADEVR
ncbi:MAG: right-handed parallel beta-helix repeat-containing protein, partial [Chloroflexota bacterium]